MKERQQDQPLLCKVHECTRTEVVVWGSKMEGKNDLSCQVGEDKSTRKLATFSGFWWLLPTAEGEKKAKRKKGSQVCLAQDFYEKKRLGSGFQRRRKCFPCLTFVLTARGKVGHTRTALSTILVSIKILLKLQLQKLPCSSEFKSNIDWYLIRRWAGFFIIIFNTVLIILKLYQGFSNHWLEN